MKEVNLATLSSAPSSSAPYATFINPDQFEDLHCLQIES